MIHCRPRGIWSWNFDVTSDGKSACLTFNWLGEQGSITVGGERYAVEKDGVLRGRWLVQSNAGKILLTAQKTSVFTRSFDLLTSAGIATLRAQSAIGRAMRLDGAGFEATIVPLHAFTRRATISGRIPDFQVACFAFWLSALMWRRAAQSD